MNMSEAIEIRDRAVRLGLKNCCDQCRSDIEVLDRLKGDGPVGVFSINREPTNEPVLGVRVEDAARRLRRSIGRGSAA